jgi:deferrochelatase/peroxidase EfeB
MAREVASKSLDGIHDIVIVAPIREGFIDAYEQVTYATRLRIISEALNDIRATAREYENDVAFADASERILSLLDFRAGIIDNGMLQFDPKLGLSARRYFYLNPTFDGVWEPYMRLIWKPLGPLLDLLFCNCEGYVFSQDNSYEDYIAWVRSAQIDSAVFFTTTGVTVSDQLYLRRLEKLQRERDPLASDRLITQLRVENPGETAETFRVTPGPNGLPGRNQVTTNRLALEALGVFYRLSDYYPPLSQSVVSHLGKDESGKAKIADGYLLQRAMHQILEGWDYQSLLRLWTDPIDPSTPIGQMKLGQKASLERFRNLIEWFASGPAESHFATRQRPVEDDPLDRSQVQRGILETIRKDGTKLRHGAVVLATITDPAKAPLFIKTMLDRGEIAFEKPKEEPADGLYRTLAVTKTGLERLAVRCQTVDAFPKEFREGMHLRAPQFGDVWSHHPRNWPLPARNWPPQTAGEAPRAPVEMSEVDVALVVRHMAPADQDDGGAAVRAEVARLAETAAEHGIAVIAYDPLENHFDESDHFHDHFGHRDNLSQPKPDEKAERVLTNRVGSKRDDARIGELLCGYGNDRQDYAPGKRQTMLSTTPNEALGWKKEARKEARKIQKDGSFLVIRKMSQDVSAYRRFVETNAQKYNIEPATIAAKLLGRYPNGTPLVAPLSAEPNDFDYDSDPEGTKCPFAAHIRRANPRAIEHDRPSPRLMRCGMSYGPRFEPDEKGEDQRPRGLMFMAYNSSISEQYETVQRWLNGGNSTGVSSANNDPLTGTPPRPDMQRTYRFEAEGGVIVRTPIDEPFVGLEWGLYLFAPSRENLEFLARTDRTYFESEEAFEDAGLRELQRLRSLPEDVAAAEWKRLIEDFDSKDLSQRDITPDIYSAIRFWENGATMVSDGIDKVGGVGVPLAPGKDDAASATGDGARPPAVIVASRGRILDVLRNWEEFSVEEGLRRLDKSSGPIYVAEQPDDEYDDPELQWPEGSDRQPGSDKRFDYWKESTRTNEIIYSLGMEDGFKDGYDAGRKVLAWLIADAELRHKIAVKGGVNETDHPEFKLELRREYLTPALALCNQAWFGLPDGGFKEDGKAMTPARFMEPGDLSWVSPSERMARCPGDALTPSRNAFSPRSNKVSEKLAWEHGAALREAGQKFVEHYFDGKNGEVPGRITQAMFAIDGMTKELAARNVIGIMLGATPPTMGNLQGIFYEWLHEQTLWRHQAELLRQLAELKDNPGAAQDPIHEAAMAALYRPISAAICKRPSPEILFRTCKGKAGDRSQPVVLKRKRPTWPPNDEPPLDDIEINNGDVVYLPLASAMQWQLHEAATDPDELEKGIDVVFGGRRGEVDAPVHACSGRKLAMGAMVGIAAALLEVGRIQAQPAGLIVRISDWPRPV